ncbi:MAG: phosphoglycerate kinase [Enterobacterales bacterium]
MSIIKITDVNLLNKRVLIRADFNVPIKNNIILSDFKIISALPTIQEALQQKALVMVTSHLGRPTEGIYDVNFSLKPIVKYLKNKLNIKIKLVKNYLNGVEISKNELVILENVRFNKGETTNNINLSKKYASLCDVFVMDAFGSSHRLHSSTYGICNFVNISCAGFLLLKEIYYLNKIINNAKKPIISIVGGSKISTKLVLLKTLVKISDIIIVGGGIANTFIASQGFDIGKSLYEPNLIQEAKYLFKTKKIFLPTDVNVSNTFCKYSMSIQKNISEIKDNEKILDFGDLSIYKIDKILKKAKTIIWNGPIGVFEFINFRKGTEIIVKNIQNNNIFSIIGGGDTILAAEMFGILNKISYVSTGGGAFLKYMKFKKLPIINFLKNLNNK